MSPLTYTPLDEIDKIHEALRAGFNSGKLKSIAYRKYQILQLGYLVKDNQQRFKDALASDLGRPPLETGMLEIGPTIGDAKTAYENVEKWAKSEKPPFSFNFFAMRPLIRKEPKGVVLIISPFNYPLWLSIGPIAGALAAGTPVCLKPSENSPATSALIAELVPKYLDEDLVRVVNGGIAESTKILDLQWDHILYTGGSHVGRIVAAAAAKHLTPVTLELGGKSPVVIDPACDLNLCARRLLWGKFTNAGQTCVAPDYVLVPAHFQGKLVDALKKTYNEFYPKGAAASSDFSRMVTPQHFSRVHRLVQNTSGTIVLGGDADEATKFIAPTVVSDVKPDDSLMSEEIFGPVLPIVPVKDVDEAIAFINKHDHPLVVYVFSQSAAFKAKVFDNTQSGATIANECNIHPGAEGLPFGGIGPSGSGYHTGKFTFDIFTHLRASMDSPGWLDLILGSRFPPYSEKKDRALSQLTPSLPARPKGPPPASAQSNGRWWARRLIFAFALAVAAVLMKRKTLEH
ncbi:hypothetical protein PLICRDRAFT_141625 [Plicaturopsis crispa FD-325 SS-3]|nr:hypothetical protein PLICRDRAFT_141625 [Plicaturopsis crispa FD-325 SS-3]